MLFMGKFRNFSMELEKVERELTNQYSEKKSELRLSYQTPVLIKLLDQANAIMGSSSNYQVELTGGVFIPS